MKGVGRKRASGLSLAQPGRGQALESPPENPTGAFAITPRLIQTYAAGEAAERLTVIMKNSISKLISVAWRERLIVLFALFVSLAQLVGFVMHRANSSAPYIESWPSPAKAAIFVSALTVLLSILLTLVARLLDRSSANHGEGRWDNAFGRHSIAISAALILASWLPYLIVFLPGSLPWDGAVSMAQFSTDAPLSNHHPVLMNALYAGCMLLAERLGSTNMGLLAIVSMQALLCVAAFSLSIKQMVAIESPRWLVFAALALFCLHPMWGSYAQTAVKDTMFCGALCLFLVLATRLIWSGYGTACWARLAVSGLLVCLVRNNGIYLVLPTYAALAVAALLAARKGPSGWRGAAGVAAAVCSVCVYYSLVSIAWPALGVQVREDREMLAVPFQQVSRYLRVHPDDVEEWEMDAIEKVANGSDIAAAYNPDLYDPVKDLLGDSEGNMEPDAKKRFFEAWLSMGLRHPATYLEATLAGTYAYFYPFGIVGTNVNRRAFYFYQQGEPVNTRFSVSYVFPQELRDGLEGMVGSLMENPATKALFSPALYVLAYLYILVYSASRRRARALLLSIPLAMLLITTLAGPLNGCLRYMMPLAACIPLLAGAALAPIGDEPASGKPGRAPAHFKR